MSTKNAKAGCPDPNSTDSTGIGKNGDSGASEGDQDAEDDDSLTDTQTQFRDSCKETKKCLELFEKLTTCNDRVNSKTKTAETCLEECIDFVHCVDHCAAKNYFPTLK